jgi:two-component system response regulator HydG
VLRRLPLRPTDLVVLGTGLPGADYPAALSSIKALQPSAEVVLMGQQSNADSLMKSGVYDFLAKPFKTQEFVSLLQRVAARRLFPAGPDATTSTTLVGQSPEMVRLYRIIERAASSKHPVLILGEKGSGKSSLARVIHSSGSLRDLPFIEVNCATQTVSQLDSAIFAPGQAGGDQAALATQGTVFIKSITEMPVPIQGRLLRALQEKEVRAVTAGKAFPLRARVIAATHRDLESAVQQGTFRRDLYLRLNVVALRLPALRERREDIPALVEHFLAKFSLPGSNHRLDLSPEAMKLMLAYSWPGNVRELEDVLRQAASLSKGPAINPAHLPPEIQVRAANAGPADHGLILPLAELERKAILDTLHQLNGNKQMAAQMLGIGKTTLYRKLKEYGIER